MIAEAFNEKTQHYPTLGTLSSQQVKAPCNCKCYEERIKELEGQVYELLDCIRILSKNLKDTY
jgi:hypothetical protein